MRQARGEGAAGRGRLVQRKVAAGYGKQEGRYSEPRRRLRIEEGLTGVSDLGEGRRGELLGDVDLLEDLTSDGSLHTIHQHTASISELPSQLTFPRMGSL